MQKQIVRATYKAFLREARRLTRAQESVTLCAPVDLTKWGSGGYCSAAPDAAGLQAMLFPGVDFVEADEDDATSFDGKAVARVVRSEFRRPRSPSEGQQAINSAFSHLATLNRLRASDACRTITRTKYGSDVVVDVELSTDFVKILEPTVSVLKRSLIAFRMPSSSLDGPTSAGSSRAQQQQHMFRRSTVENICTSA